MILEVIVSLVIILVTVLVLYLKWSFRYWKSRNVYTPEPSLPFGNVQRVILGKESLANALADVYKQARARGLRYAGFHSLHTPVFIAVDSSLIQRILIADFQYFTDRNAYLNEKRDPLIGHMFFSRGAKWRALRNKLSPLFSSGKLKIMFQTFVNCTNDFPNVLEETIKRKEPLDIKELFERYTIDIIGSVGFGIDCNCFKNPDNEFRKYGKKTLELGIIGNLITSTNSSLMSRLGLKVTQDDVEKFFMKIVKETIDYRDKNNYERKDFMQLLMNLRNKELKVDAAVDKKGSDEHVVYYQNGLTLEDIAAQAFVFFTAGFETSSTTLNFLMYELAKNLDIQQKVREEIESVLKAHDGKLTYEAIQEMTYMDKAVNETLRKYPPFGWIQRLCMKDYQVPDSDLIIKKGTPVFIPSYGIQYDPEYYPDPEKFEPERFSEENKNKRPNATFLPFGDGPRICIGLRMGVLQTKVGLTALLKDYKFTLSSKTDLPLKMAPSDPVLIADGGVWVNAQRI